MQKDDGDPEDGDGEGVTEGVEEAEAHAFAPVALNAGDVRDGGEVVVVEAVAQAEQGAGEEGELEGVRHGQSKGTVRTGAVANGAGEQAWLAFNRMKRSLTRGWTAECLRFCEGRDLSAAARCAFGRDDDSLLC